VVKAGNALEAALLLLSKAFLPVGIPSLRLGNEAISKSLFYTGFDLKLTRMPGCPLHTRLDNFFVGNPKVND